MMVHCLSAVRGGGFLPVWIVRTAFAIALMLIVSTPRAETLSISEGTIIKITREAVLNGVTLAKGTELRISNLKKDESGTVSRVDLQQLDGDKKVFKAITPEALAALIATPTGSASDDRSSIFKVAAQIPIVRELALAGMVFPRGSVLQIDRVEKDKNGKVVKLDLRETSGPKRLMRNVAVEQLLFALSPDEVTWPDGAVGRMIVLGGEFKFGRHVFAKGTKLVVTRVDTDPKKGEVVRVDLQETEGDKRELASVPVAVLKQNGALGTAAGAPK
jgi:hypothetical protein